MVIDEKVINELIEKEIKIQIDKIVTKDKVLRIVREEIANAVNKDNRINEILEQETIREKKFLIEKIVYEVSNSFKGRLEHILDATQY